MADIDLSGRAWAPIGSGEAAFSGTLDGNGFSIKNLAVDTALGYAGLFGYNSGLLFDIRLENATVSGTSYAGGLVGCNTGEIIDCSVSGVSVTGNGSTGGLAGCNYGNEAEIKDSSAAIAVNGANGVAGGFVGIVYAGAVENCTASGNVSSTNANTQSFAGQTNTGAAVANCAGTGTATVIAPPSPAAG
jgi:hypothetical protein